jgi:hypothetical protein
MYTHILSIHRWLLFLYTLFGYTLTINRRSYTCEGFDAMLKCYPLAKLHV